MRSLEWVAHSWLKDRPIWKSRVKWAYQRLFSLFSGSRVKSDLRMVERPMAFFGFHDKSPWSSDGNLLLGHTFRDRRCLDYRKGRSVQISVFSGEEWKEAHGITSTQAWNWQQGSQLQWVGDKEEIVYNDFRDGVCVAVRYNLGAACERVGKYPVAAVSPDGRRFASICFKTLGRAMSGYGYAFDAAEVNSSVPAGELIVGTFANAEIAQIKLKDLDTKLDSARAGNGVDFFSHCLFSPDNKSLLFLRRQTRSGRRLRSEMFCVDLEKQTVERLPFHNMVSHFTWLGEDKVLAYANTKPRGDSYYCVDLGAGTIDDWGDRLGRRDGHPNATRSGDVVVYDTYPDGRRHQRLYLWKAAGDEKTLLARLYTPMRFWGECRVDLHPRIREDGSYISFDASFDGVRALVTAPLISANGLRE